ncbi:MAG: ATP-binding cassette domain-containing protein [Bdellovibrionales bacterium]|nr:ATP-binding cassette domain-containing protein [Bdellovibrionales bacterium]
MILQIKALKKYFHVSKGKTVHAVDGIELSMAQNEILGLVGESGCGKSTLGRTIVGLYEKTSGEIWFDGEKMPQRMGPEDFKKYSRKIQMIFQDPYSSLNPRMTVRDIIAEGPVLHGLWKNHQIDQNVGDWLERVGLSRDHLSRYPHEFSGGQRQRIGIARALALEPKFVVCDEPISALDVSVQAQVINLLAELKEKFGLTLLFIAHDLSMVRYVSDRMAVMYLGSMVELGPANEVYFRPMHPYTQLLIQSNPEADPALERKREHRELKGEIPTPVNVAPGCRFAGRCPSALPQCRSVNPSWKEHRPGHFVACHLF